MFRADLPAPIEWKCASCGDEGVISGWEDSPFDLRVRRPERVSEATIEVLLTDEVASTLRDLKLLDTNCERLVFRAGVSTRGVVLPADAESLDELIGFVAAEANHETNRRNQKRLDDAYSMLSDALAAPASSRPATSADNPSSTRKDNVDLSGRWRILEMDLWDRDALDLVGPAFVEFAQDRTGSFGFIAVKGWMDTRQTEIDSRPGVEFTWNGIDEGDQVSGRGWAALQEDGTVRGHIHFHMGDDSAFRAARER